MHNTRAVPPALLGTVQFAIGAGAGALVSTLHNGTALPMVGAIARCGVAALLCLQFLMLRPLAATLVTR